MAATAGARKRATSLSNTKSVKAKKTIKALNTSSSDCAACRGRHRAHVCGKQIEKAPVKKVKGCLACAGRHRAHTCR